MEAVQNVVIAFGVFLGACAAVTALGSAWSTIQKFRKPAVDGDKKLEAHDRMLDNDNRRINELEESNRLILRGQMQLITHELDGNHIDKLREVRDAMEQYLIDK